MTAPEQQQRAVSYTHLDVYKRQIVFCTIFLMCFILPIWLKQDMNYQDPTQKNIAPGMKFLDVPKELQGNAKKIEAGPTFGVGIDNDGVVYELSLIHI